jgi:hypothetical protein
MSSNSAAVVLARKLEKMGYTQSVAVKVDGVWMATSFDPLNEVEVKFDQLGASLNAAILKLSALPTVPKHYICGHSVKCKVCGVVDKPTGYTERTSGDFMHRCRSCGGAWVAMTAAEQEVQAKAWMDEAIEVLNPAFRRAVNRQAK